MQKLGLNANEYNKLNIAKMFRFVIVRLAGLKCPDVEMKELTDEREDFRLVWRDGNIFS